jgi:hypothetical protein
MAGLKAGERVFQEKRRRTGCGDDGLGYLPSGVRTPNQASRTC